MTYPSLDSTVVPGGTVLLDDGAVRLTVISVGPEGVRCTIENDGEIGARRGVNLPGMQVDLPPLSSKDKVDVKYAVEKDMDFVAASFVRKVGGAEN